MEAAITAVGGVPTPELLAAVATAIVLAVFEADYSANKDEWRLIAKKGRKWLKKTGVPAAEASREWVGGWVGESGWSWE